MAGPEDSAEWRRVEGALEACFLALDRGEDPDILGACEGDERLAARVRELLASGPGALLAATAEPLPGPPRMFGDFEILKPLGRGGMGSVYLANQKSLSRQVALKLLDNGGLHLPNARLRMRREAELTALLEHPNIVPIYAVGETDGTPFLAMKHLTGPSLAEIRRPLTPERVAQIGTALARALDTAHVHGIVHRDVKPANVLLDGDVPVFVDFGLARAQSDPTMTQEGKVAGTLRYMAPERLDARTSVLDPRVDIYGLGAVLYELLAAHPPFEDDSPTALMRSVLSRDPVQLHLRGRHHDLETIVMRAMAREPERRFATAAEMADDLERYLARQPVVSRRISLWTRFVRRAQRHPRAATALVIVVLLFAAAANTLWWQHQRATADRDRRIEVARNDLDHHHHERAHASLSLLAERHPGDTEVAGWLAQAGAQRGIDRLFVALVDRSSNVSSMVLDELLRCVTPDTRAVTSRATTELALVLATGHCRGQVAAHARLTRLPRDIVDRRAARAIAAWLDDAPLPWQLPSPPVDATAEEAVFAGLALRLAGAAPQDVLGELSLLTEAARGSPRALFLEAVARADAGEPIAAMQLLRGLADDEAPAPVWRWLANVYLQLGRLPEAGAALARAADDHSPTADYFRLVQQYLTHQEHEDEVACLALVEQVRRSSPMSAEVQRFLLEYDGKSDPSRAPEALTRLQQLWDAQQEDRIGRDLTLAAMIEVAARPLALHAGAEGGASPEYCGRLITDWQERAATIRYRPAAATADDWLARAQCRSGRPGDLLQGLERFAATCAAFPLRAGTAIAYAEAVALLPAGFEDTVRRLHTLRARDTLVGIERAATTGSLTVAQDEYRYVEYYAFLLAWQAQDMIEMARRLPAIEDALDDRLLPRARSDAATAAQATARQRER